MQCEFSHRQVQARIDSSLPVECPECGAVRKIPGRDVYSDGFTYPPHQTLDGTARLRKRYKRRYDVWGMAAWYVVEADEE